jgi:hypothetical protein
MTTKDAHLFTRVQPDVRAAFERRAKAKGLKPSELMRRLVLAEIGQGAAGDSEVLRISGDTKMTRMVMHLPVQLKAAIEDRAKTKGMTAARWTASLAQSNLMKLPVMSDKEVNALLALNRELAAVGRNVNQIAKQLNSAVDLIEKSRVDLAGIDRLQKDIELTRKVVRSLMLRSQQSWEAEIPSPGEE